METLKVLAIRTADPEVMQPRTPDIEATDALAERDVVVADREGRRTVLVQIKGLVVGKIPLTRYANNRELVATKAGYVLTVGTDADQLRFAWHSYLNRLMTDTAGEKHDPRLTGNGDLPPVHGNPTRVAADQFALLDPLHR